MDTKQQIITEIDEERDLILSEAEDIEQSFEIQEDTQTSVYKKVLWEEVAENSELKPFLLENPQLHLERPCNLGDSAPEAIFKTFFDENVWKLIEEQTNLYIKQTKDRKKEYLETHPHSRLNKSNPITQKDIMKWLGLRMLIPLHSNAQIESKFSSFFLHLLDNWSSESLFSTKFKDILSLNDFWRISASFHLTDNQSGEAIKDKLH